MACGCPVVLANHSSFPEVAGDAGVYFELNNPDDLREKVASLVFNKAQRDLYIEKGYEQVKREFLIYLKPSKIAIPRRDFIKQAVVKCMVG
jgi:glycosyltransferase involved in cell wall biosynthesis